MKMKWLSALLTMLACLGCGTLTCYADVAPPPSYFGVPMWLVGIGVLVVASLSMLVIVLIKKIGK